jgi:hypothetical protein
MRRKLTTMVALLAAAWFWNAQAYNNPHILEFDLDIDGVADGDEFYEGGSGGPGGFVASNGLKRITLTCTESNLPTMSRLNWNSDKIEVYQSTNGTGPIANNTYWSPASSMPTQLWVKGVKVSDNGPTATNCGPEHLTLEAINNGADPTPAYYDRIAFTVYAVTNIVAIPKGITTNDTLPDPVTIGAGAMDSEAHQADVKIQVRPAVANIPVEVSLLDGRGHDAGKDAKLAMGTATATGGLAAVTVPTAADGSIIGLLTSSDVINSGTIHAGQIDKTVAFRWDQYREDEQWTNVQEYLPFPGVLTNYVVLRHHRNLAACSPTNPAPYKPFIGHEIRFFVEQVEYWDANGVLCVTNSTPPVSGGLSDFAAFVQEAYTTDGGGQVVPLLQVYTNYDIASVTMVGYDYSVWNTAAVSGAGTGGSGGTAGSLQAGGGGSGGVTPQQQSPADVHPGTPGTNTGIRVEITPTNRVGCAHCLVTGVYYGLTANSRVPNGVTWAIIPSNLTGGASMSGGGSGVTVSPGNVGTTYVMRATSVDNSNCFSEASLTVYLPGSITQTNWGYEDGVIDPSSSETVSAKTVYFLFSPTPATQEAADHFCFVQRVKGYAYKRPGNYYGGTMYVTNSATAVYYDYNFDNWVLDSPDGDPAFASPPHNWHPPSAVPNFWYTTDNPGPAPNYPTGAVWALDFELGIYCTNQVPTNGASPYLDVGTPFSTSTWDYKVQVTTNHTFTHY